RPRSVWRRGASGWGSGASRGRRSKASAGCRRRWPREIFRGASTRSIPQRGGCRRGGGTRWRARPRRAGPAWGPTPVTSGGDRVRYHDGGDWLSDFDSAGGSGGATTGGGGGGESEGLPVAVEVAIWFGEPVAEGEKIERWPEPDRLRVIAVPDGPVAGGGRGG